MASKFGKMLKQTNNLVRESTIPFGRVSSCNGTSINIQNTIDSEARDLKMVGPYGLSSCPIDGLFAQIIINNNSNSVCAGVHNPNAPKTKAGETILYSSGGAYIKLGADGSVYIYSSGGAYIKLGADGSVKIDGLRIDIG